VIEEKNLMVKNLVFLPYLHYNTQSELANYRVVFPNKILIVFYVFNKFLTPSVKSLFITSLISC